MHHALVIDEIVRIIVDFTPFSTLLGLGLASRLLYEPAMNARWRSLSSLAPLLLCLPSGKLETIDKGDGRSEIVRGSQTANHVLRSLLSVQ